LSQINVLVATTPQDLNAEVIAAFIAKSVKDRPDMSLVEDRFVSVEEVDHLVQSVEPTIPCALVLVGPSTETNELAVRWLAEREHLVVMHIDAIGDLVRIGFRDVRPDTLLTALRELVDHVGAQKRDRVAHVQLRAVQSESEEIIESPHESTERPLLTAASNWVHALLREAVENVSEENGDVHGFSVTRATLLQSLDAPAERILDNQPTDLSETKATLDTELEKARDFPEANTEPLAVIVREFDLDPREFQMLVLTLAPELDVRYQRCKGFLLDEMSRRVGTMGLNSSLLGLAPPVRGEVINGGALARWLVFEGYGGHAPAADEPLRLDPFLVQWLLGDPRSLESDPRVRRVLRLVPWPGASILDEQAERATRLIKQLQSRGTPKWIVLDGDDPAAWRALLERGAEASSVEPIRVDPRRLAGVDLIEVEECARRLGRLAVLTKAPLVIDLSKADGSEAEDEYLRLFLATLNRARSRAAAICVDEARMVQLLGNASFELAAAPALPLAARVQAVRAAARGAGITYLVEAEGIANRYPLSVDSLEQAMRLAASRPKNFDADDPYLERFITALKEVASEGISHLVERIEPVFTLEEVVLPPDRKTQLIEIVDQIRLAEQVLDGWKFRDKLPYGRGVAALFFGASGTGKTMAAMGIANRLGIQILRLELSRIVSKYIGDTEKNLDSVFTDAQRSGAAILIDEADALLGKRSEVKDAHDRYANIEVAYLLQRMEAYEGLAILTTNMRKNLDPAFLRRLRFMVDFPRPDVEAREKIWRQCLPDQSHQLSDADFRQLARRLDLTGGQIRQITLRAAFIAAAAGMQINLEHVAHAASAELTKLGMAPIEIDLNQTRRAA
jgi:AAA+ superfamily predicted ATPase